MNYEQWTEFTIPSNERQRTALALLRRHLPDHSPFRGWLNFQFLSLDNAYFPVDALIFSPVGVFLLEFASHRGRLELGADTWLHEPEKNSLFALDNPLGRARQKAERLHKLLEHFSPHTHHIPSITPLVFLTEPDLEIHLDSDAGSFLFFHPEIEKGLPSIFDALIEGRGPGLQTRQDRRFHFTTTVLERFQEAVTEAAFDSITRYRRHGDYRLEELLDTTDLYQDFRATHPVHENPFRARLFRAPQGATDDQLARLMAAARREFSVLDGLSHRNILKVRELITQKDRPTVVFEHPPGAIRLDHFMEQSQDLPAATRFHLLQSIAEAIRYAHGQRVIHRALTPQSVLVIPSGKGSLPQIRIFNWHTSAQDQSETATRHISDYLHDRSQLFLAPELIQSPDVDESADIFGLGALAFFLFTGEAPARDLPDFIQTLATQGGLRLTSVRDAVSAALDTLVFDATRSRTTDRIQSADAFLERLASTRNTLVALGPAGLIDPLNSEPGALIADRYRVERRLGSGATATAFLASDEDRTVALKISNNDTHADRLLAEAEALGKLDHPLIVDFYELFHAGGRTILSIQYAGKTFRARLRETRALSLDNLHRFGADLCEICQALENQRVFHRDIKPSNLGLADRSGSRERQHLMLFDFSLAGVSIENVAVGTAAYRDPFLVTRRRWDAYADRYSAALVLYEMVTQQLPRWGDGRSSPTVDPEATLQLSPERFPAAVRDSLQDFFLRALARDIKDRHDNAIEMANAWRIIFEPTLHTDHGTDTLQAKLQEARPDTPIAVLGISQLAIDALDSQNISTVSQLLATASNDLRFITGVSGATRTEILDLHSRLADLYPNLLYGSDHQSSHAEPSDFALKSVDHLLEYVRQKRGGSSLTGFTDTIDAILAPTNEKEALPWADYFDLASRAALPPGELKTRLKELAQRWGRQHALSSLREDIIPIIDAAGGILDAPSLSFAVLGKRGSLLTGRERIAAASAVTRAAVEAELVSTDPRFFIGRHNGETFIATRTSLLEIIPALGQLADDYANRDPLASPERVYDDILDVLERAGLDPIDRYRALSLAAAASEKAALSKRNEIYPRGMSAIRALNLTANVLLRQAPLSEEELRDTVSSRYPDAEPLPERSVLIDLLEEADIALRWNTELDHGRGAFVFKHDLPVGPALSRSTEATSFPYSSTSFTALDDVDREVERFEERLSYKERNGGFLAITVNPARAQLAPQRLADDYNLELVSIEELFLKHIKEQAASKKIDWNTLLRADAPDANDRDRQNFSHFLRHLVIPALREELLTIKGRILFTQPGLLARWNDQTAAMSLIDALRDELTSGRGPELVWLLIPGHAQRARPHIDGTPVPVTDDSEYTRIPSPWLSQ